MNNYRIEFELYDIINSLFANYTQYFSLLFSSQLFIIILTINYFFFCVVLSSVQSGLNVISLNPIIFKKL